MKSTLSKFFATLFCSLVIITTIFSNIAHAGSVCDITCQPDDTACVEIKKANGCDGATGGSIENTITNILSAIILISGTVAVIFIVVGGVTYMTSAGDAGKVSKAKNTILYACIGLIICVLAFTIVNFVIKSVLKQSTSDDTDTSETQLIQKNPSDQSTH